MKIQIIKNKNIKDYQNWAIWTCEKSTFDWTYDQEEHCYIIEGEVTVKTAIEKVHIKKGDYVMFPKNLSCIWTVIEPLKKYYIFK